MKNHDKDLFVDLSMLRDSGRNLPSVREKMLMFDKKSISRCMMAKALRS